MEEWKNIPGFEGLYQVSDWGRVFSKWTNRELTPNTHEKGHLYVTLIKNRKRKTKSIHHLVAETFIPNPNGYDVVHHIDYNPQNNRVENLVWLSKEEHDKLHAETKSEKFKGQHFSKETEFKKGHTPWIKGKKHSIDSIEKMKQSHKGHTPWNKGKKGYMDEESKRKIGEANKERNSIPIIQIKNNKVIEWKSAAECAKVNKQYNQGAIREASKGKYSFKKGHQYKDSMWYEKKDYEKMLEDLASQQLN